MTTIARQANETRDEFEHRIAGEHGHIGGCFGWIAEEIVEDLAEQGIDYETGNFDEDIAGATVLDRIIERLENGKAKCRCVWLTADIED